MAKLTLSFKDKKLKIFPITGAELVIGRDPACAIHIDSLAVHPLHARVYADGEAFCIENLQAEDPVQINNKPLVEPIALQDGDHVQVGKHTLSFSSEPAGEGVHINVSPQRRVIMTGWLQIMSGSHLGRSIRLDRAMTRLGKSGQESAIIVRREDGYFISHLEGETPPQVNGKSIADASHALHDGDRVRIGRLELHFYMEGEAPAAPEVAAQKDQRRFTRIAFDSAAALTCGDTTWNTELVDLSLKGALIQKPDGWSGAAGDSCQLVLTLDDDSRIRMAVTVARIDEHSIGLACHDIDLDSITHLRRLVELNLGDAALLERELMALG